MAKKSDELDGMDGPGVEPLVIEDIDKAIAKYERKKDARCKESPGEIAAKQELQAVLHAHRDELPKNEDGEPYYRSEERDYVLTERVVARKIETADAD